jgi:hypothetical protein
MIYRLPGQLHSNLVRRPNYGEMPHNDKPFKYKSSIWDQSFLLTVVALAAAGLLYSLELLSEDRTTSSATDADGGAAEADAGDGDGGDD